MSGERIGLPPASGFSPWDGATTFLPLRSHVDDGALPSATREAFDNAVSGYESARAEAEETEERAVTWRMAAARWRVEAIRERLLTRFDAPVSEQPHAQAIEQRVLRYLRNDADISDLHLPDAARECCGEHETGSGQHGDECAAVRS